MVTNATFFITHRSSLGSNPTLSAILIKGTPNCVLDALNANSAILEASTIFFARPSRFPRLRARASASLIIEHGDAANVNLCDVHRGPKTYEFRLPTLLTGIASFQDPYLISVWFMGSHWTREGNARRPPALTYAGIPLELPRGEMPGPMKAIRFKDDCLNDC